MANEDHEHKNKNNVDLVQLNQQGVSLLFHSLI
jgi:hypothetical protein